MTHIPGYCALCRAKELAMYGDILNDASPQHERAVKEAGCQHPAYYGQRIQWRHSARQKSKPAESTDRTR